MSAFKLHTGDRLDRLGALVRRQRSDGVEVLIVMWSVSGDFNERVTEVEQRTAAQRSLNTSFVPRQAKYPERSAALAINVGRMQDIQRLGFAARSR